MIPGKRRAWSLFGAALLGLLFALAFMLVACGEDGVTPDCPPLPLYNVHDENYLDDASVQEARGKAIEAGCLTELGDAQRTD